MPTPALPIPPEWPDDKRLSLTRAAPYVGRSRTTLCKLAQRGQLDGAVLVDDPGMPHPAYVVTVGGLRAFLARPRPHGVSLAYRDAHLAHQAEASKADLAREANTAAAEVSM